MPYPDRSQGRLIKIINDYLAWNNLPFNWDAEGICHGLATVHTQYLLQGKEDKFYNMLDRISGLTQDNSHPALELDPYDNIDFFITQVVLAFSPRVFDKQYHQDNSYELISVEGKSLTSTFNLSMVTNIANWEKIIKDEIKMQEGETFLVSNTLHTVSVHYTNGEYVIYDPNYAQGKKTYSDEKTLMDELAGYVFKMSSADSGKDKSEIQAGLTFKNITKQDNPHTVLRRNAQAIYADYFKTEDLTGSFFTFGKKNSNREMISKMLVDASFTAHLIKSIPLDEKTLNYMCSYALEHDYVESFLLLNKKKQEKADELVNELAVFSSQNSIQLDNFDMKYLSGLPTYSKHEIHEHNVQSETKEQAQLILQACKLGSRNIFNVLKLEYHQVYEQLLNEKNSNNLLLAAVQGGQPEILKQILGDMNRLNVPLTLSLHPATQRDLLDEAIQSNAHECVSILLKELHHNANKTSEFLPEQLMNYLNAAINNNNLYMVDALLNFFEKKEACALLQNIPLNSTLTKTTNIHILNTLKEKGAVFNDDATLTIQEKKTLNTPRSLVTLFGVSLAPFFDFAQYLSEQPKRISESFRRALVTFRATDSQEQKQNEHRPGSSSLKG